MPWRLYMVGAAAPDKRVHCNQVLQIQPLTISKHVPLTLRILCGGVGTRWIYQSTSVGPIIDVPLPVNCPLMRFIFVSTVYETTTHPPVPQAVGMIDTLSPPSSPPNCVLPPETAYITLARYADRQYQGTVHHMQSSTFEAKKELLRKSKVTD